MGDLIALKINTALPEIAENLARKLDYEFFQNFTSEHTKKSYRHDLRQFFGLLARQFPTLKHPQHLERFHLVAFRNSLSEAQYAPKTINRKLSAVSSYLDFLTEKGLMPFNPCSSIKRPRQQALNPTMDLSDEKIQALMAVLEKECTGKRLLHRAIITTLFTTGMRKAELIHLKVQDKKEIEGHQVLEIMAKGAKRLIKTLHPSCAAVIDLYLRHRQNQHPHTTFTWLFTPTKNPKNPSDLDKPLRPNAIDYMVKSTLQKAGISGRLSAHSARASYIGSALENNVPLQRVSQDVGHVSVRTTQSYNRRPSRLQDGPVFSLGYLKKSS